MFLEVLRASLAVGFLLVLPGYALTCAIFPRRGELATPVRAFLTVVLSACTVILVGAFLGFLPHDGRGLFQTIATGMPFLEIGILAVTAGAGIVAYERGGLPWLREWVERRRAASPAASSGSGAAPGENAR